MVIMIADPKNPRIKYKIVLLGDQHVGKTSIIDQFINKRFGIAYNATIGIDFLVKNVTLDGRNYRLQLWDTAGQERFKSLIPSYLKDASCCLLVYDVANPHSLDSAAQWLRLYNQHKNELAISIVVGNKADLSDKKCSEEDVNAKFGGFKMKRFEVSAKESTGIQAMFQSVITELDNRRKEAMRGRSEVDKEGVEQQIETAQQIIRNLDHKPTPLKNSSPPSPQPYRNCCQ